MKAFVPKLRGTVLSCIILCLSFSAFAQNATPKIAFISDRDGTANVYVMEAEVLSPTNLTNGEMDESSLAWSPDGQTIAFSRAIDNDGAEDIFTVGLGGSPPVPLTNGKRYAGLATWSPDGSQVAFSAVENSEFHVTIINADGSGERLLIEAEADSTNASVQSAWSPDGAQIVFRAVRGGVRGILTRVNADGSNEVALNKTPADDSWPTWSPDGTRIAFTSYVDSGDEVFLVNADGSNMSQLTKLAPNLGIDGVNWSPDGAKIALSALNNGISADIFIVSTDSGDAVNLTQSDVTERSPVWSPDGSQILFMTDRDGDYEIYIMNSDGSNPVNLTNNPADDTTPLWQPAATGSATNTQTASAAATPVPAQAAAPNPNAIPVPDGLQVISAGNAGQVSEVLVSDPDEFKPPKVTFEGDLAGNRDWIRAITTISSIGGLAGPAFTADYSMGAISLIDSVGVVTDMNAANAFRDLEQWSGVYSDLTASAFSTDGATLAVGDQFGLAALWDVATGEEIANWQAHSKFLNTVFFTPDGTQLITLGYDGNDATIGLWNPQTGEAIKKITSPDNIYAGALNADGSLLAAGGDGTVVLWDMANGQPVAELVSPTDFVSTLTFNPDGTLVAMGDDKGTIFLWNVASTELIGTLTGQLSETDYQRLIVFMSFSPDGRLLLTTDGDGLFHFWGTTAEAGAAPQPQPTTASETVESATPAPTESSSAATCSVTANGNANLRSGPGTTFDRAGALAGGEVAEADGQSQAADGFTWYRLSTGAWVRADLVTAEAACEGLAVATS